MLGLAVALQLSLSAPGGPDAEPTPPAPLVPTPAMSPSARWLPVQASVTFTGLFGSTSAVGASAYVGFADGFDNEELSSMAAGPFWGLGPHALYGFVDAEQCGGFRRCAQRWTVGPALRTGWAWGSRGKNPIWPDTFVFAQVTPFFGASEVPSAPLAPAVSDWIFGTRVDLGLNSVAWSRQVLGTTADALPALAHGGEAGCAMALAMLALTLVNHFEVSFEWSVGVLQRNELRAGFSVGTGF